MFNLFIAFVYLAIAAMGASAQAAPMATFTSAAGDPTPACPIIVDLAFTVPVTGLSQTDFLTTNSRVITLSGSGANYQFSLYPKAPGYVQLVLPAGAVQDTSGTLNAAASFSRTFTGWPLIAPFYDLSLLGWDMILYGGRTEDYMASYAGDGGMTVGDFNGDRIDDLLIGSTGGDGPNDTRVNCGEAAIVFGRADRPAVMDAAGTAGPKPDLIIYGADNGDVMCENGPILAGDLNNDGYDDMIIGAWEADGPGNGRTDCGEVYIIFGRDQFTTTTLDIAAGQQDVTIYGASASNVLARFGDAMKLGDVNGDGYKDLVIGNYLEGKTYVIYGRSSWPSTIDLAAGQQSVTIIGGYWPTSYGSLAVGDFNGDGKADIAIGEPQSDGSGIISAGRVYLILGSASLPSSINCTSGGANMVVYGSYASECVSMGAIQLADFDLDGRDDLLLGSTYIGSGVPAGKVYVIYGQSSVPASINLANNQQDLLIQGASTPDGVCFSDSMRLGDFNGDGWPDLALSAWAARGPNNDRSGAGEVDLIFGSATRRTGTISLASHQENAIIYGRGNSSLSVSAIADINHDHVDDLICNETLYGGKTYVFYGKAQWPASFDVVTSTPTTTIYDSDEVTVIKTGDFNGDFVSDIAIGERDANGPDGTRTSAGEVDWVFGVNFQPHAPEIGVYLGSTLIANGGGPINFGKTTVGAAALTKTFVVKNRGTLTLHITDVAVPDHYSVTDPLPAIIPPNCSDTFTVALNTSAAGTYAGNISISTDDTARNPYQFAVTGAISMPEVAVLRSSTPIANGGGPIDFGVCNQGAAGSSITFTVQNPGLGTLTMSNLTVPDGFAVTEGLSASIPAGGSDTFTVAMLTTASGVLSGNVSFNNNVAGLSPFQFSVVGRVATAPFTPKPREELWVTDQPVNAVATMGNKIFIGGSFWYVGPCTGAYVPFDTRTGQPMSVYPKVTAGAVYACAPDGANGWYIGGSFTEIDYKPCIRIAHILPDGTLDPNFNPNPNGNVSAIAVSGSILYVGGAFTSIGGQARNYIAALNVSTGQATAWNPNASNTVSGIVVSGSTIFVKGFFTTIGGQSRKYLAALDAVSGQASAFNPNPDSSIAKMIKSGSVLYVCGGFSTIGGQLRKGIAALNTSGTATTWNANSSTTLYDMDVTSRTIYVLGYNNMTIGGQTRNVAAALDTSTALATSWVAPAFDSSTSRIVGCGSNVYIAGSFLNVAGQSRRYICALDAVTGALTSWNPGMDDMAYVLVASGTTLWVGGQFRSMGGVERSRIAALDNLTGAALPWNPNSNGSVSTFCVYNNKLYVGGNFTNIGGQNRNYLAALDPDTGLATSWNPNANSTVNVVRCSDSTIYAGGSFTAMGGQTRNRIASFTGSTGVLTTWNPNANSDVSAIKPYGSIVFAGGAFTNINGQARNCIAALDAATAVPNSFNPFPNYFVRSIDVIGSTVYFGGQFTTCGYYYRNYLAAYDITTGQPTSWNPNPNGSVCDMLTSGSTIYIAGYFSNIDSQSRTGLASVDAATGWASSWAPSGSSVTGIAKNDTSIVACGQFGQRYVAQFEFAPAAASSPSAVVNSSSQITWGWTDNSATEDGYNVWVDAMTTNPTTLRTTTAANAESWVQTGLLHNTRYSMQVAGTNGGGSGLRTPPVHAWTLAEPISALNCVCGTNQIQVTAANPPNNLSAGMSGMYFEYAAGALNSGWKQDTAAWTIPGLTPNTQYVLGGRSRNAEGIETTSTVCSIWTAAATPPPPTVTHPTDQSVRLTVATGDGNPACTQYAIRVSPAVGGTQWVKADGTLGDAKVWLTASQWLNVLVTGLAPATQYQFCAIARNSAGVETPASAPTVVSTIYGVWVAFNCAGAHDGSVSNPFATLGNGISAVAATGGTIFIKGDAAQTWTSERPRITTHMRIEAVGGPVRIGVTAFPGVKRAAAPATSDWILSR